MGISVFVIGCIYLNGSTLTHSLESAYCFNFILLHEAAYCSLRASWSSLQSAEVLQIPASHNPGAAAGSHTGVTASNLE